MRVWRAYRFNGSWIRLGGNFENETGAIEAAKSWAVREREVVRVYEITETTVTTHEVTPPSNEPIVRRIQGGER